MRAANFFFILILNYIHTILFFFNVFNMSVTCFVLSLFFFFGHFVQVPTTSNTADPLSLSP